MKLPFKNKFLLAPMEEVNDIAFRLLCKKAGAGITYTGMIHPQTQQEIILKDFPALQLFCTTTKSIDEFVKKYDKKVLLWDFNLGCPAKTARKKGFGVFLHKDLKSIEKILKQIRKSTKKPLTVKLRKSKYVFKILKIAEKYCDAICIHPRTQQQGYGGIPDLEFAEKLKSKTNLPVIYSGNIDEKNAKEFIKKFDYLMIGRKAIGNPNIFAKLQNKKSNLNFNDYLKLAEKYKLPFRQIKFQAMNFTKTKENAKQLRLEIFKCKKINEIKDIFNNLN
jgi:tRNA-dihydrouridine synthase